MRFAKPDAVLEFRAARPLAGPSEASRSRVAFAVSRGVSPGLAGVTAPHDASPSATRPNHVCVYGNDHSPWVQSVLLGLHEKEIAHTLVTVPPLSVFWGTGVLMPAAKIDGGSWLLDSERILVELGFSEVEADAHRALQVVFLNSAMRRADDSWNFWHRFSFARDGHPMVARRLWNHFWRSFSIFYFFTLITIGRRMRPKPTAEELAGEFSYLQEQLVSGADFFGGDVPDTVDLQLFGLVQMCSSIPVPSLAVLQGDPTLERLREWIETMQQRFSGYTHLYSARIFEPKLPEMTRAPALERCFYWSGAALMWIAFPITLPAVLYFARRAREQVQMRG
jgi:glutathione S-transferase